MSLKSVDAYDRSTCAPGQPDADEAQQSGGTDRGEAAKTPCASSVWLEQPVMGTASSRLGLARRQYLRLGLARRGEACIP